MKKFIAIALFNLFSASAFAWPTVGDRANYDMVIDVGQQIRGSLSLATTELNSSQDQVTVHVTTTVQGEKVNESDNQVSLSEFRRFAETLPSFIAACAQNGGTPETITTPAGTFNTCKIPNDSEGHTGFTWFANVVYGWVKQVDNDTANGQTTTLTLNSFSLGQ